MAESTVIGSVEDFQRIVLIGQATDGAGEKGMLGSHVELARHKSSSQLIAVKWLSLVHIDPLEAQREVSSYKQLRHANILPLLHAMVSEAHLVLVTPFMGFGSCYDLLQTHFAEGFPEAAVACIVRQVATGLHYLHDRGVIHRSIQAGHLLISNEGTVRLSGLRSVYTTLHGGTRDIRVYEYPPHITSHMPWTAPEVLAQDRRGYDCRSDIYSLGITCCELCNGVAPFTDIEPMFMLLQKLNGVKPVLLDAVTVASMPPEDEEDDEGDLTTFRSRRLTPALHDLVTSCLNLDPAARPSAAGLLSHQALKDAAKRKESLVQLLNPVQPVTLANLCPSAEEELVADLQKKMTLEDTDSDVSWDFSS